MLVLDSCDLSRTSLSNNEDLFRAESHVGKVVDVVVEFSSLVDRVAGHVVEIEFLFIEDDAVYFNLRFMLAHDLKKDGAIAMENIIYLFSRSLCCLL